MWKTVIQPHIDYCSQLFMPSSPGELEKVENLFRNFTRKIPELKGMHYLERLNTLKVYSQHRRMERYRSLYAWKILKGLVPYYGLEFFSEESRRGTEVIIPKLEKHKGAKLPDPWWKTFQFNAKIS